MQKVWFVWTLFGALVLPATALASPAADEAGVVVPVAAARLVLPSPERLAALMRADDSPMPVVPRLPERDPRRAVLSALHALTGVVQTYDGMLTMRVIRAGGTETNPLMKPVAGNEGAMMGVKVAAAVATVIGTETLWRDNHRIAAIVASVVVNGGMAMIARHNAQVLARLEGR